MKKSPYLLFIFFFIPFLVGGPSFAEDSASVPSTVPAVLNVPGTQLKEGSVMREMQIKELWDQNKKREANKLLKEWMDQDKKLAAPWVLSASFRFEEGQYKKCLSLAETALEKNPQSSDAYYWRGRAYEALNKLMESANEYRAALLLKNVNADTQVALNRVLEKMGTPVESADNNSGTSR